MTRPRTSTTRELFGIIGKDTNARKLQAEWNVFFEDNGMDAFIDCYPTTIENLPERLSEMFHFDRRLYIVSSSLQEAIKPLLDSLDKCASEKGRVDIVVNENGVLTGKFFGEKSYKPKEVLKDLIS